MADVAGRILDRAGAVYNVRHPDFAADATGASNATTSIQAALDAAAADGGGTVVVPAGTYLIGYWGGGAVVPLSVPSGVHLWIQHGAALRANPAISVANGYANGWASRGMIETTLTEAVKITLDGVLDGQKALNPDGRIFGIYLKAAKRVRIGGGGLIKDMPADPNSATNPGGLGGDGIVVYADYPTNAIVSEDVVITGITVDGVDRSAISPLGCKQVRIEACTLKNTSNSNPGSGIDIEPDASLPAQDVTVRGCTFYNNHFGIHTSAHCDGVVIEGNTFRQNRHVSIATRGKGVTIANNTIKAYRNQAMMVFPHVPPNVVGAERRGAVITGNIIEGDGNPAARAGLFMYDVSGVVVAGNRFYMTHDSAVVIAQRGADGAHLTSRSVQITNNHFEDCVDPSRSFTGVIAVRSDQSADATTGELRQVYGLHIQGNTLLDTRGSPGNAADYGISFTGVSDAEKLTHKVFDNSVTGIGAPISGGTQFSNRLSVVVNIDPGPIAADGQVDVDVAVNGAAPGDTVIVNPQSSPGANFAVWNAWPVAANTVRLRLHNNSASSIDPSAAAWRITVLKH